MIGTKQLQCQHLLIEQLFITNVKGLSILLHTQPPKGFIFCLRTLYFGQKSLRHQGSKTIELVGNFLVPRMFHPKHLGFH